VPGAPVATFDLDVVHSRSPENVKRLLKALESFERVPVSSAGHQLLMTRFGPLGLLGLIGAGYDYADLVPHAVDMQIGEGLTVRMLDLETCPPR
jgi:hypothetical protein